MWRLWLAGKLKMHEFDTVTIDEVDAGNRALDAWEDAGYRVTEKTRNKGGGR